ncbi:hypothetical protein ARMGADRAFT_1008850, partial [Armillaria gallica]
LDIFYFLLDTFYFFLDIFYFLLDTFYFLLDTCSSSYCPFSLLGSTLKNAMGSSP